MSASPGIQTFENQRWLSNCYLLWDRPGGTGVLIDSGGDADRMLERVRELELSVPAILCTHRHPDHVLGNARLAGELGLAVHAHRLEAEAVPETSRILEGGECLAFGDLRIGVLHIPGHTVGHLAYRVNERWLFTGDTLFRGTVGGTMGRGHGSFEQLRESLLEVLLGLPDETVVWPGHMACTTVAEERSSNPFIEAFARPTDSPGQPAEALDRPARLLLRAPDYDGGTKCWVRFEDGDGELAVVAGSRVSERPRSL